MDHLDLPETRDLQVLMEIKEELDHLVHKDLLVPRDHLEREETMGAPDPKDTL